MALDDLQFIEGVRRAVDPTNADIALARAVIQAQVGDANEPVVLTDFEDAWLLAHGVERAGNRDSVLAAPSSDSGRRFADPDPLDRVLMTQRCQHSIRWAVAQLIAEGVLVRGEGNQHPVQPLRIPVSYVGGGDSVEVFLHSPHVSDPGSAPRFLLAHPEDRVPTATLPPIDELLSGLDALLGRRGEQLIRESRRALRVGLYLASSSLLAAASEAAWFNLGRTLAAPDSRLARTVDEGRDVSEVIHLTAQSLSERRLGSRALRREVVAHAHLLRDVRNYALHPIEPHDADRETWLTEAGATLLALSARRYLAKLAHLQELGATAPAHVTG